MTDILTLKNHYRIYEYNELKLDRKKKISTLTFDYKYNNGKL